MQYCTFSCVLRLIPTVIFTLPIISVKAGISGRVRLNGRPIVPL